MDVFNFQLQTWWWCHGCNIPEVLSICTYAKTALIWTHIGCIEYAEHKSPSHLAWTRTVAEPFDAPESSNWILKLGLGCVNWTVVFNYQTCHSGTCQLERVIAAHFLTQPDHDLLFDTVLIYLDACASSKYVTHTFADDINNTKDAFRFYHCILPGVPTRCRNFPPCHSVTKHDSFLGSWGNASWLQLIISDQLLGILPGASGSTPPVWCQSVWQIRYPSSRRIKGRWFP